MRLGYRYRRVYNVSWSLTRGEPSVAAAVGFSRAFPFSGENRSLFGRKWLQISSTAYICILLLLYLKLMSRRVHTEIKTNPCCRVVPLRRAAKSAAHRKYTSVAGAETRCTPAVYHDVIVIIRGPLRQDEWEIRRVHTRRERSRWWRRRRQRRNPCGRLTDSFTRKVCAADGRGRYSCSAYILPIFFHVRGLHRATPTDRTSSILRGVSFARRRHLGDLMNFCPL